MDEVDGTGVLPEANYRWSDGIDRKWEARN
jgi:hypothetical protein